MRGALPIDMRRFGSPFAPVKGTAFLTDPRAEGLPLIWRLEATTTYDVFADASWYGAPTDGYEATREAAMEAVAKSWRQV